MLHKNIKKWGRTTVKDDRINLFWTGSAVEVNVTGSELQADFYTDYESHEIWISIVINGSLIARQMLNKGYSTVCIFRGMSENTVKNVRIIRDTQAMNEDKKTLLQICDLRANGEFLEIQDRPYKIEFIGDSITTGEGCFGAKCEDDWIPMLFSAVNNYSYMLAENINAEYRVIAESGWGINCGWDNNINSIIPPHYEKICGLVDGEMNVRLGAHDEYNFAEWQPDFIVINLGTNDATAFNQPAWIDEVTRKEYKMSKDDHEDIEKLEMAIVEFLKNVRKNNINSYILWGYGMLGNDIWDLLVNAVTIYKYKTGDTKMKLVKLPNMTDSTVGSRQHPGILCHEKTASVLTEEIEKIIRNRKFYFN